MDFFSSSRAKKEGKKSSGLFGKKSERKSNPASPPHPPPAHRRSPSPSYLSTEYHFPFSNEQPTSRKQPASERIPNSHSRPPVYGYGTPERRRDHGRERMEAEPETNAPSSPFHPSVNHTPERSRNPSDYSGEQQDQMYERDARSNASPFHPFKSLSPSPDASIMSPYTTPDRQSNKQLDEVYEQDCNRNSYSSSEEDNLSTYLFPEIATPSRSMPVQPVHRNYQIVSAETYEHYEPPELPDESQGFTVEEVTKMRGLKEESRSLNWEAHVSVAKYRVKESVGETLKAILDKYGDIAAGSKLQSMVTRSYYLESLAAVVMELRWKELRDLTETRVEEMAAVVKDMESVKIEVAWLKKAVEEVGEAVKHLGEYEKAKKEREAWEREAEAEKGKMEEMKEELRKREKEIRERREKVTAAAGKAGELEMKGMRLNKKVEILHSKVDKFQGEALLLHL